jgi:hypothetical protein
MSDAIEAVLSARPVVPEVLRGKDTLRLDPGAMHDKIINLRFFRKLGQSFSIRSDYEPRYGSDGSILIKRCLQKPQIKVSYKQMPGNVVTGCVIDVHNLYLDPRVSGTLVSSSLGANERAKLTKEEELLEENGNPVRSITLQMGYISQFPDWSKPSAHDSAEKLKAFFALDNSLFEGDIRAGSAVELHLSVLSTHTAGLPPDRVTRFQCVTGTLYPALTWKRDASTLLNVYGGVNYPSEDATFIEKTLFNLVTKRFVNTRLQCSVNKDGTALLITSPFTTSAGETIYNNATPKSPAEEPLAEDGRLTDKAAMVIGVQCLASQKLRDLGGDTADTIIRGLDVAVNADVELAPLARQQRSITAQLRQIRESACPELRWFTLLNGDYFCFGDETGEELCRSIEAKARQKKEIKTLPAIYDMTVDGMRSVRAPFHGFVNPLTTVRVNARYNLGTMVGFYYPKQRYYWLVAVTQSVEFSTTGEENVMELQCVDMNPGDVPEYNEETGKYVVKETDLSKTLTERLKRFNYKVEEYRPQGSDGRKSRIEYIAEAMLLTAKSPAMSVLWEDAGKTPTVALAIKVILERNKGLLDTQERRSKGISPEYEKRKAELDALGVDRVPYIYEGDVIKFRIPWEPGDDGTLGDVAEKEEA